MTRSSSFNANAPDPVPKVLGGDFELGNFVVGGSSAQPSGYAAAETLLHAIDGRGTGAGVVRGRTADTVQDRGRRYFASNGGCAYNDLDHVEICIPEVRSAQDFVAYKHAMLDIVRQAMIDVDRELPVGQSIEVLVNNSDGLGHAYGSHTNFLLARRTWDEIFRTKLHHLLYLASFQVSSIIFSGQGKVGAENGHAQVPYQISARGDFFECLVGTQTTHTRPIVNARDEPLCARLSGLDVDQPLDRQLARLHVIFFDNTLCHVSTYLTVGVMQIILTMIESDHVDLECILDDPVDAIQIFSRDPSLRSRSRTASGTHYSAVELQLRFLESAKRFVEAGACDGVVPDASAIVELWEDTVTRLCAAAKANDPDALSPLAPRLDWVLKRQMICRAIAQRPHLNFSSPEIKHLDHLYSSLSDDGLFRILDHNGFVERIVSRAEIDRCLHEPPSDTRAWTRAMLLRHAPPGSVAGVDWDRVRFKCFSRGWWPSYRTLLLDSPLDMTRATARAAFGDAHDLEHLLDLLESAARSTALDLEADDDEQRTDLDVVDPILLPDAAQLGND